MSPWLNPDQTPLTAYSPCLEDHGSLWEGHLPNLIHKEQFHKRTVQPVIKDGQPKPLSRAPLYSSCGNAVEAETKLVTLKESGGGKSQMLPIVKKQRVERWPTSLSVLLPQAAQGMSPRAAPQPIYNLTAHFRS